MSVVSYRSKPEDLSKISVLSGDYNRAFKEARLDSSQFVFDKSATSLVEAFSDCDVPKDYFEVHLRPEGKAYEGLMFDASYMFYNTDMHSLEILELCLDLDESMCSKDFLRSISLNDMFCRDDYSVIRLPEFIHFSEEFFLLSDKKIRDMFCVSYTGRELSELLIENNSHISNYIRVTSVIKDILRQFNSAYESHIKTSSSIAVRELCKSDCQRLLQKGNTIEELSKLLSTKYQGLEVSSVVDPVYDYLYKCCREAVSSLLEIQQGMVRCKYSIGEIRQKLQEVGYSGDIVDKCILESLADQYVSL